MKFFGLISTLVCLATAEEVRAEDSSLTYTPTLMHPDQTFVLRIMKDETARAILNGLNANQRGQMDKLFNAVTAYGAFAEKLAVKYAQQDAPVRKNALNYALAQVLHEVQQWCQPRNTWFCVRRFADEAAHFIATRFCSVYTSEMRRETCTPEATLVHNSAQFTANH